MNKEQNVYAWFDSSTIGVASCSSISADSVNEILSHKYGSPPIVRTYNGESASEFGLKKLDDILRWNEESELWTDSYFDALSIGDRWMLQPPPPK
jgi:hypothetical protein